MTNSTPSQSMPYLGRCKECDYALSATEDQVKSVENFRDVVAGAHLCRVGNNGVFARCPNRHKVFAMRMIEGKFNPDHKCDSRCLNAKGWDCTCACGGINHGRGHALTVTTLPSEPSTPIDADRHKGEVTHTDDEPTEGQLTYIGKLADELGELAPTPSTRARASDTINDLKARIFKQREVQAHFQPVSRPMTDRQRATINKLMKARQVPAESRREARERIDNGLTTVQASRWIERLLELPEIPS